MDKTTKTVLIIIGSLLPWYVFTGFAAERSIVTFAHGLMTSIAILGFHYGKRNALLGYLAAVGLHALINLGPILLALRLVPATVSSLGSYAAILLAFLIFQNQMRVALKSDGMATQGMVYFER